MTAVAIEPFGFFTMDALRAGWWLSWRLFVRVAGVFAASAAIGLLLIPGRVGGFIMALGFCAGAVWSLLLVPRLTSQWAHEHYGQPLDNGFKVWWGITWRSFVVSLVAAVILAVPNVVALSLKSAYSDSLMGSLAGLMISLLNLANVAVSILATGWAMSRVTAEQLSGLDLTLPTVAHAMSSSPRLPEPPAAQVLAAPRAQPVPSPSPATSADGKRQCPKCGLYETERGSVIGWYCKVCGWREARR